MFALYYLFVLALAWLIYSFTCLAINRKRARQMNLRIVMSPVDNINILWIVTQEFLVPLIKLLPFGLGTWVRHNQRGWQYREGHRIHEDFGEAFVHTTPVQNQLYIANAEAAHNILSRRRDFVKPTYFYKWLESFGKSVLTVEGDDWLRHRRITAPALNEHNNRLVWAESLRQAREMLSWWKGQNSKGINTTDKDVRTLALHVLMGSVFGNNHPFRNIMIPSDSNFKMTFKDALILVLGNLLVVPLIHPIIRFLPFAPKKLATIAAATVELRRYMNDMLQKEKQMISQRNPDNANLMSHLIRASQDEPTAKEENIDPGVSGDAVRGLSNSEIVGNVFFIILAGHETTANTLSYAILLLAAHPEVQEWVAEEVRYVLQDQGSSETWDYELFSRFKRCLAIMLETLRINPVIPTVPKYTNDREQSLEINGEAHVIPSKTMVSLCLYAIHTMPRYWGVDSLVWRPSRWIVSPIISRKDDNNHNSHNGLNAESIIEPRKGTFMPWSDGSRACPGKKFSEVEFVAVIITLLRDHRVRPTVMNGETEEEARQRIIDVVNDSHVRISLQMRHPTRAMVSWVRT